MAGSHYPFWSCAFPSSVQGFPPQSGANLPSCIHSQLSPPKGAGASGPLPQFPLLPFPHSPNKRIQVLLHSAMEQGESFIKDLQRKNTTLTLGLSKEYISSACYRTGGHFPPCLPQGAITGYCSFLPLDGSLLNFFSCDKLAPSISGVWLQASSPHPSSYAPE